MKKWTALDFIFLLALVFPFCILAQVEDEKIKEKVSVTNVEVPVRVFYKGKAVDHLNRKDFKLYEDDKLQTINGFFVKRRKIETQNVQLTTEGQEESPQPSRLFVLVFRLLAYNEHVRKAVDHFFKHILHDNDQLLVFANDSTLMLDKPILDVERKDIVDQILAEEAVRANQRLIAYFSTIQRDLDVTKTEIKMERDETSLTVPKTTRADNLTRFLNNYLSTWREYKKKYLLPDIDRYYNFASFLEKVNKEKWVINVYQIEMFPKLKVTGELRQQIEQIIHELQVSRTEDMVFSQIMMGLLNEIDRELNVADEFPAEEISKLFYKVDTTCHSIFCGVQKETFSQDLEFKRISTNIENSLREITANTGGSLITSDNLESAMHTISSKEDLYYMLTYEPDDPQKKGKIKVTVKNKKYKVVYDSNMRADYIKEYLAKKQAENPSVQLKDVSFNEKKLSMEISNFLLKKTRQGNEGRLNVRVRIKDSDNQSLYDKSRYLETKKKITNISIDFEWLTKGEYNILVDVTDLLTGKTAMEFLQPRLD